MGPAVMFKVNDLGRFSNCRYHRHFSTPMLNRLGILCVAI
jgi:hypothetical protein